MMEYIRTYDTLYEIRHALESVYVTYRKPLFFFFFQAEDGIRGLYVTGVQTCALPISFYPAPSHQWSRQPVPVLGEIVAEAALHAGRALVGCVQLDVGRGDAHDFVVGNVQVDLASDAAVRTDRAHDPLRMSDLLGREPLPRHHLEDRAGGTDADALS